MPVAARPVPTLRRREAAEPNRRWGRIALVAMALATLVAGGNFIQERADTRTREQGTAIRLGRLADAAQRYVAAHEDMLSVDIAMGGAYYNEGIAIPMVDGQSPPGTKSVAEDGFLPADWPRVNAYGQREWLLVRRISVEPLQMAYLVVTNGGENIPDEALERIAAAAAPRGGFIGTAPANRPDVIASGDGRWSEPITGWQDIDAPPFPGHLAAALSATGPR